ncbi:hypothetical protein O0I10_010227 [Lichtheimia ornata]|uniref:Uncharacterized protein n=2 Tax=Lichtheimia ornata TaxID=688661 RepID=A0AAD7UWB7_9FUNG|nr:uncharacterized protein O0I10_010227 [Lichtheimia ornata]KAJ8654151.1 hypothetical protein O0I10_010227 [Lichtheimia ornata]
MGEQVVNGDTFSYNKHVRDLPMTQASIPIQHFVCRRLHIASFGLNMLDDGTSGSNRMRISKQECCMVGSMQQDNMDDMEIRGLTKHHTVTEPLSAILLLSRLHVKDVIVLYFPVELYMLCPGTVRLMLRPQGFKNASSVRTAPSFYGY